VPEARNAVEGKWQQQEDIDMLRPDSVDSELLQLVTIAGFIDFDDLIQLWHRSACCGKEAAAVAGIHAKGFERGQHHKFMLVISFPARNNTSFRIPAEAWLWEPNFEQVRPLPQYIHALHVWLYSASRKSVLQDNRDLELRQCAL
jgi:hypothetical protein